MNVPKLRFKEFSDEWKKAKLSSFVNINPKNNSLPDKFIYIDLESVNNGLLTSRKIVNKSEAPSRAQRTIIKNDILYQTVRPYQMNNLFINSLDSDYPYIASTGYALLRTKENPYFVYSILYQKSFVNKVLDMCTGTSYPAISANDLGTISICLPSIKEQEKIGKTLSLLDKKIELQTKKIEDLKLFKLSKYSSVFSKSNNKIKLSDICIIEKGKQINSDLLIEKGNYYMLNGGILPSGYLNEYNTNENTVTISEGGNSCGYVNFNKTKFWCGGHCYKIISSSVNSSYLYHLLKHNEKIIMDLRVGSGLPNIQKKDLEALKLSIHKNDEQLKIGILFDTFDKKINLETKKLNKFKELKKALMQVMFV